jgi:hypothetical protein
MRAQLRDALEHGRAALRGLFAVGIEGALEIHDWNTLGVTARWKAVEGFHRVALLHVFGCGHLAPAHAHLRPGAVHPQHRCR